MHYTLTTHRLFGYFALSLRANGEVSEEELSSAYEEFEEFLSDYSNREESILGKMRELYHTEIELMALLQFLIKHPDALLEIYLNKTCNLVKTEIKLTHLQLQHPEYSTPKQEITLPPLHWNGSLINLMELITSLDYSGIITDTSETASLSPDWYLLLKRFSIPIFLSRMICVPTLPGARRIFPSCFPH